LLKYFRAVVIVAVLPCWSVIGGVAVADPANLEDVTDQFKDTPDGLWRLHVSLRNMNITSVPNMAATAFTREAFVSAAAEVWVEALHPDDKTPEGAGVMQRSITLWLEQGCQANLQTTTLGAQDYSPTSLSDINSTGTNGAGASTGTTNSVTPNAGTQPEETFQQQLLPGYINRKLLDQKVYPDLKANPGALNDLDLRSGLKDPRPPPWVLAAGPGWLDDKLTVAVRNWDLKVDSCAGPVSFRFQAGATMSTPHFDTNVDAYGAIVPG
jgi:hypothetical protein